MKSYSVLRGSRKRLESDAMRRVCICPAGRRIPIRTTIGALNAFGVREVALRISPCC